MINTRRMNDYETPAFHILPNSAVSVGNRAAARTTTAVDSTRPGSCAPLAWTNKRADMLFVCD